MAPRYDYYVGPWTPPPDDSADDAPAKGHWSMLPARPARADFVLNDNRLLLDYWLSLPRADGVAIASRIEAGHLGGGVACLAVLEVERDGADFRYQMLGARVSRMFRENLVEHTVAERHAGLAPWLLRQYRAVHREARPVYAEHVAANALNGATHWCRLLLPIADRAGSVNRIIGSLVPVQRRR